MRGKKHTISLALEDSQQRHLDTILHWCVEVQKLVTKVIGAPGGRPTADKNFHSVANGSDSLTAACSNIIATYPA